MKSLIREIHRRSLWQVLGIYLGASWLVLQAVDTLAGALSLPDWSASFALFLLILGLPVVLATAFVQEGIVTRDPEPAPQSLADAGEVTPSPAVDPEGARKLFTWKRAFLGGAAAFVLLLLGVGGWIAMRTLGIGSAATLVARGVLEERDRILLADFINRTSDENLAEVVTEALRVDLAQSDVVRLADPAFVSAALVRMARPANAALEEDLARELAQREGIKAVIAGDVGSAGAGFVLTARLVAPATGDILASGRESADADGLISAIDALSKRLRERLGESLRNLGGDPPLERVTTANLAALERYTEAVRIIDQGVDSERGITLLEEAVALDTAFAMAYRKLGQELVNRGRRLEDAYAALTRAYEHRDRLTERERGFAMASYFSEVVADEGAAVQVYENMVARDPTDDWALNNLGASYGRRREWARAEEMYARAIAVDSTTTFPYTNAAIAMVAQGKYDDATRILETLLGQQPHSWRGEGFLIELRVGRGDLQTEAIDHLAEDQRGNPFNQNGIEQFRARLAAKHGRVGAAEGHLAEAERAAARDLGPAAALTNVAARSSMDLFVRRDPAKARAVLAAGLEAYPLDQIPAADRPYVDLISVLALTGDAARAGTLLEEWERSLSERERPRARGAITYSRGTIALGQERYDDAAGDIRASDEGADECVVCILPALALAYDRGGQRDSALAVYERIIDTPYLFRTNSVDGNFRGHTLERLGQLFDEAEDYDNAVKYYAMFVGLWAEADEELQPRVRAAQARLQEILSERG